MEIRWYRVPSRGKNKRSFFVMEKETRLYELLNKLGIISGGHIQSFQILHNNPKKTRQLLSRLRSEKKIIEHTLTMGNKKYKLYTLGPNGAQVIGAGYQPDYWFDYSENEVIERVISLEFYLKMEDYLSAELIIEDAEHPYLYTLKHNEKIYNIGVAWDNAVKFMEAYRWELPQERTVLICQNISQLNCILEYLDEYIPIRAVTRKKIKTELVFYKPENGKWVLDLPNKKIITKPGSKKIIRHRQTLL